MRKKFLTQVFQNHIRKIFRHPKYRLFAIIAGLFYLISPLDIAPDVIPVLGWLDDGLIASFVVAEASQMLVEEIKKQRKASSKVSNSHQTPTTIDVNSVTIS